MPNRLDFRKTFQNRLISVAPFDMTKYGCETNSATFKVTKARGEFCRSTQGNWHTRPTKRSHRPGLSDGQTCRTASPKSIAEATHPIQNHRCPMCRASG